MNISRREFIRLLAAAGSVGLLPRSGFGQSALPADLYQLDDYGHVRLLHFTDCHAQLLPIYFREPHVNIGIDTAQGRLPHLVGEHLLAEAGIAPGSALAHAFTYLDFHTAAQHYGKVGGFAHLRTLIKQLRESYGISKTLLLDGGDTWQGSGTAYWTRGQDMVDACNLLGVDVMTGHWEFTYQADEVLTLLERFNGDFVAQNVRVKEDALFDGAPAYDEDTGHAFPPYAIKELGNKRIAVIGQSFPYTPIANPSHFIPDWTFGIRDDDMQSLVDEIREREKPDAVILLSHNGMDVDLKMASVVSGIDAILGGHTHDGMPKPIEVKNAKGITVVTNAGSNGKFLAVLDLELGTGKMTGYRYRLLPIFSNALPADQEMNDYISQIRTPYLQQLNEPLAVTDTLLYRRGNFNGTFDQLICDALRAVNDAQIALSPGFRWGTSVLPGQAITMENVLDQTCITYPETYVREMSGSDLKLIMEDVCDNLFNPDPYYQQGGDMVRVGGFNYVCDPTASMGQRISAMTLDDGSAIEANKMYKVAGWATVGSKSPGPPIWDQVAEYLRNRKTVAIGTLNSPTLKNVAGNPGIENLAL